MSEWLNIQEIEPEKDGEYIIAFFNEGDGPHSCCADWHDGEWWENGGSDNNYGHLAITHWMPIPDPPRAS
jgi:hypothetical protein